MGRLVEVQVSRCPVPKGSSGAACVAPAKQLLDICLPWESLCDPLLLRRLQRRQSPSLNETSPRAFVICITETKQNLLFKKIIK